LKVCLRFCSHSKSEFGAGFFKQIIDIVFVQFKSVLGSCQRVIILMQSVQRFGFSCVPRNFGVICITFFRISLKLASASYNHQHGSGPVRTGSGYNSCLMLLQARFCN
jgi:hypothetical protein